jgi:hypothetical protein
MSDRSKVVVFLDDDISPIGVFDCPVKFQLNTTKLQDGNHTLRLISTNGSGKEGIRVIPFTVKNGPEISVEGISENATVDGEIPIMINAYGKTDQRRFIVEGSETPRSVPAWVWALILTFFAWAAYYTISSLAPII